jgi:FkbM family methyltransferase
VKQIAHRLINRVLLKPFGLRLSYRVGGDPIEDMALLLAGTAVSTIIDGGAYAGAFSRRMAMTFAEARIHAFEPTPASFALLEEKTRGLPVISSHQLALGASSGVARFFENASPLTNSLRKNGEANRRYFSHLVAERGEITVKTTTLAAFARDQGLKAIDIVKLDLQGGELDAIVGLGGLIATVKAILVEVQFAALYEGAPLFSDIETHLRRAGMALYQFYDLVRSPGDGRLLYGDAMFIRGDLLCA